MWEERNWVLLVKFQINKVNFRLRNCKDGSAVKDTCCPSRVLRFSTEQTNEVAQLSVTATLKDPNLSSRQCSH